MCNAFTCLLLSTRLPREKAPREMSQDQCGFQGILSVLYSLIVLAFAGAIAIIFLKRFEVSRSCCIVTHGTESCSALDCQQNAEALHQP